MRSGDTSKSTPLLINASDIAEIAGVGPSAVSNWKRRPKSGFPPEVEDGLYSRDEVVAWLRKTGRDVNISPAADSTDSLLWRWADEIRGVLRADAMPELLLQLMTIRAAGSRRFDRLMPLADAWADLHTPLREDVSIVQERINRDIGDSDPDLLEALRISSSIHRLDTSDWVRLVDLMDQLDPIDTDWGTLVTTVVTGFIERSGARGGEFSSGKGLIDVMAALLEPVEGTIYDPACGTATFLASVWDRNADSVEQLFGQEINEQSWRLGFLHLLLHGARFRMVAGDTLLYDRLRELRADRIALEPPIGQHLRYAEQMENDPRWVWGLPPKSSADLVWLQHAVSHLADGGIGVVAVSPSALTRSGPEESIRIGLIDADLVDAVVHLPPGMLGATSIPVALVVLQRNRSNRSGQVLFVDARQLGTPERGGLRRFASAEIDKIATAVRSWRDGSGLIESQFSGMATAEEVIANDGVLMPNRYISYAEAATEIAGEPIRTRYERLVVELEDRLVELPRIEAALLRQVSSIDVADE